MESRTRESKGLQAKGLSSGWLLRKDFLDELALEQGVISELMERRRQHPNSGTWSKVTAMRKARQWEKSDAPA